MQERQLIKKIKELRQIKPNKDWVSFTKREILEQGKEEQIMSWLFIPFNRPALVVRPLIAGVLILAGFFVYLYLGALTPQLVQLPFASEKQGETEVVITSLVKLQESLERITLGLNNLKNAKDPNQVLVMTEIIKATAKEGERVINQIKDPQKEGILASLAEIAEVAGDTQVEVIGALIEDLKQGSLTEEDELRLEKAIEHYNGGEIGEAMFWITRMEAIK